MRFASTLPCLLLVAATAMGCVAAHAGERVTLRNGFAVSCDRRESLDADHVRLFLSPGTSNYVDIAANSIASVEPEAAPPGDSASPSAVLPSSAATIPASQPLESLLQDAGRSRRINVDLLRAVVHAESGGRADAISHAGAQGLMQLMPATAQSLGVRNSLEPRENVRGGTDDLDALLHRYHDDLPLALAAYNAGPGAVDRYHGVPPYRETRLYVARIIREFNRRTLAQQSSTAVATTQGAHTGR